MSIDILRPLDGYLERFPADASTLEPLVDLLHSDANPTSRSEFRGHITCGAIVFNPIGLVLMVHHRTLNKWLFPGGHLESNDTSLREAALRELNEETGLAAGSIPLWGNWLDSVPLHIDAHAIPSNEAKREPRHIHFDFRFAFRSQDDALLIQESEVFGAEWVDLSLAPDAVRSRVEALNILSK